jgi:hypothetical protein
MPDLILCACTPSTPAQVFDKWEDDSDTLVASCALPLTELAALTAVDAPGAAECSRAARSFLLPLTLEPGSGEAAAAAGPGAPMLQVQVSYSAAACYAAESGAGACSGRGGGDSGRGNEGQQQRGAGTPCSRPAEVGAAPQWLPAVGQRSPGPQGAAMRSAESPHRSPAAAAFPRRQLGTPSPAASPGSHAAASPGDDTAEPLCVPAELCIEITRACGLQVGWTGARQEAATTLQTRGGNGGAVVCATWLRPTVYGPLPPGRCQGGAGVAGRRYNAPWLRCLSGPPPLCHL